jgi:hypothetical protein
MTEKPEVPSCLRLKYSGISLEETLICDEIPTPKTVEFITLNSQIANPDLRKIKSMLDNHEEWKNPHSCSTMDQKRINPTSNDISPQIASSSKSHI